MSKAKWYPAITKKAPYGICWTRDCWEPAVLKNVMCERHQ